MFSRPMASDEFTGKLEGQETSGDTSRGY